MRGSGFGSKALNPVLLASTGTKVPVVNKGSSSYTDHY